MHSRAQKRTCDTNPRSNTYIGSREFSSKEVRECAAHRRYSSSLPLVMLLAAAQILEDALSVAIQAQVGANPNVATAQAAIADVLNAVVAATGG